MISYPHKPMFYSRTIYSLSIKRFKLDRFLAKKKKLEMYRHAFCNTKFFKSEEKRIKLGIRRLFLKYFKRDIVLYIFKRNSGILRNVLFNRKVFVHKGNRDIMQVTLRRMSVLTKRIGQFVRTKYKGKVIHLENRISKKLAKKKKQIASEVMRRRARKSKKVKAKAKAKYKKKK